MYERDPQSLVGHGLGETLVAQFNAGGIYKMGSHPRDLVEEDVDLLDLLKENFLATCKSDVCISSVNGNEREKKT